jgi:dynein heavy chain, axonemal
VWRSCRHALLDATGQGGGEARLYEDLGTYSDIKPIFEGLLAAYNEKKKPMNLVFFEDALEHLARIHRTIRLPQGNCLLVGVGGSGKQSLSKLAAYTAGCEVFEITLTRGYDEVAFREDIKKLYAMLGAENKKVGPEALSVGKHIHASAPLLQSAHCTTNMSLA